MARRTTADARCMRGRVRARRMRARESVARRDVTSLCRAQISFVNDMESIRNWAGGYERVGEVNKVRARAREAHNARSRAMGALRARAARGFVCEL